MVSKLHAILKPFVLRRLKSDVCLSLPPKAEVLLYAQMSKDQRQLNQQLLDGTLRVRGWVGVKAVAWRVGEGPEGWDRQPKQQLLGWGGRVRQTSEVMLKQETSGFASLKSGLFKVHHGLLQLQRAG